MRTDAHRVTRDHGSDDSASQEASVSARSRSASGGDRLSLALIGATLALLVAAYVESLRFLTYIWVSDDNYSHGILVPLISTVLIWRDRKALVVQPIRGCGAGLLVMGAASGLFLLGELATVYWLLHLSFVLQLVGLFLATQGTLRARSAAFPLAYLFSAIPLPSFLYQAITGQLQLISSALGIGCLQLVGITAFQEGNVIDLGPIQLQVVEACSGLRYLFPLVSLSLLAAHLFRDRWWKRIVVVLSSVPISILLNGVRIGMIGILVEWYGPSAGDGFLHVFEGWILFVASIGLLVLEIWILRRIGVAQASALRESASEASPSAAAPRVGLRVRSTASAMTAAAIAFCLTLTSTALAGREDVVPTRHSFLDFPQQLGQWRGQPYPLEVTYLDALRLDDYYLADFHDAAQRTVNVYLAYYRSQRKGQSAHSPKSCIPGGGWEITALSSIAIQAADASSVTVNRAVIQKETERQVVYYWFKQRERSLASEYLVKWFIFWDALLRHRTDGALIRLATPIGSRELESGADARLASVSAALLAKIHDYVPD